MGAKNSAAGVTLLASLAFFTVGSNLLAYAVVQEPIISEFKLSLTDSGLLVSVFFLMYSLMQIPGGYLADKWGGERTIALFTTFTALAAIGLSFVSSFWLALVLRIAIGFGNGPLLPAAVRALTRRLQGHQLEVANGFFGAGWGVAQILVLNLLPTVTVMSSWRTSLLAIGVTTLGVSAYAWIASRGSTSNQVLPVGKPAMRLRETITRRTVLLILINVTGIVIPLTALTWAPIQFVKLFRVTAVDAARVVSIFGVLTIISSMVGGFATKTIGGRRVMIASMAATLGSVLLLTNPVSPTIGLLIVGVLGFASMFYISANFSLVPGSAPAGSTNPGFVFGVYNTISNAVSFFPPLILAYILETTQNFALLYLSVSVVAVIGLVSSLLFRNSSLRA